MCDDLLYSPASGRLARRAKPVRISSEIELEYVHVHTLNVSPCYVAWQQQNSFGWDYLPLARGADAYCKQASKYQPVLFRGWVDHTISELGKLDILVNNASTQEQSLESFTDIKR